MEIGGFQRTSLMDYPGKLASIVFVTRCNMRCPFCHNPDLVSRNYKNLVVYPEQDILAKLKESRNFVDAVVVTGGEPTLDPDLANFISRIKELKLLVKLDTNGSNPRVLADLLQKGLLDYIAMDIKAVPDSSKYKAATGTYSSLILDNITKSIDVIMNSGIDYEFRTTVVPSIVDPEELLSIAKRIEGAKAYYIQQFVPGKTLNPSFSSIKPYETQRLRHQCKIINESRLVEKCELRA